MIYVTGDTHGDFKRIADFCQKHKTSRRDVMIILGDVGLNYYGGERDEVRKREVSNLPITLFCIHGNHENRPENLPNLYHVEFFNKGAVFVQNEYPNILFAMDGQVYHFNGLKTMVIGGAYSVDKPCRIANGMKWFPDEQPSADIKTFVENTLDFNDQHMDVFLTHTCPEKYIPIEAFMPGVNQSKVDRSTEHWLGWIEQKTDYKMWYCGHYHINKMLCSDDAKTVFLFDDIVAFPTREELLYNE